ncbi:MAG: DUF4956 domain-containing protein [Gammaproteobacteria bacterium]|nr:DUF4956 domain-containing protein [Gammaproteobacteria bacterium]NNF61156.1 DUF4956 domain-containing protein [Gammaproteobacteria bacterium]NNM19754.1 DUF4956 domain-containing protein [Gammaproteobacteria bacterium]
MRKSIGIAIPASIITVYYLVAILGALWLLDAFPAVRDFFPVGGIEFTGDRSGDSFEPVYTEESEPGIYTHIGAIRLAVAMLGTAVLMVPISWVYFITYGRKEIDQSFVQTVVMLPIVVAGIATIVQNSLALAFSLAGIVAAVRFRFTLDQPAHALYIFAAIGIGLGAGIGALGVATVISIAFVYATLALWKLEYGGNLRGKFLSFISVRDTDQDL